MAFLFEYPGLDQFGNAFYIRPVAGAVRDWRKRYYSANRPILSFSHGLNFVKISDSRLGKADEYVLSGPAASVFLCCQEIRSRRSIGEAIGNSWNGSCEAAEIDDILAELVRGRLLYCENDRYLSLAIPERAIRREGGVLASSILKRS